MPEAIAGPELAAGRLRTLRTTVPLPELDFFASWRITPEAATVEAVATIAAEVAAAS